MQAKERSQGLKFGFTSDQYGHVDWAWQPEATHRIYHVTWKPKPMDINILSKVADGSIVEDLQNEIIRDLQAEVAHFTKKRKTK